MNTSTAPSPVTIAPQTDLKPAIAEALKRIPPLWPLENFVAVNPFLGLTDRPFAAACTTLRRITGRAPVQSPREYLAHWKSGTITPADLAPHTDDHWPAERLLEILEESNNTPLTQPVSTFADMLDHTRPHAHWSRFVAEEIAKWCAVHFDRNQTTWISPWRRLGLFAAWKSAASHDAKPEAFGLPGFRAFVRGLPDAPCDVIHRLWHQLAPRDVEPADFFHRQLVTISGWGGHVQYLVREANLRGKENPTLLELLAIRLAYDSALHHAFIRDPEISTTWKAHALTPLVTTERDETLARWQSAYETGYQKELSAQVAAQPFTPEAGRPPVQAVFCIDVRSEVIRRSLETTLPGARTLGFAGFFGFPISHQTADGCRPTARCPVLLAPPITSRESPAPQVDRTRAEKSAWKAFQNSATSCFTFVESLGLGFGANLIRAHDKSSRPAAAPAPQPEDLPAAKLATLAENALRGMSLTKNFARLVLFSGHGSHSANNPFGSSLHCGACGGYAGDVNARLAAATLNRPEIRAILVERGIEIPADTHFMAARHDTLSDDFLLYDEDNVPAGHQQEIATLESALKKAGSLTRAERAHGLGLGHLPPGPALDHAIRSRGTDIAQLRPEWALANNAALIAAPRSRTAALKLHGRIFLHEYDPAADPESKILTAILTAPVVVASWINLQYYGSRIDPEHLCAGDKTIHQVVAGIGVIEGNAGDLRSGLPLQSIHNGVTFVHEPRRLTVIIESQPELIDAVLSAHSGVRELFDHQWLHLICLHGKTTSQRRNGTWHPMNASS